VLRALRTGRQIELWSGSSVLRAGELAGDDADVVVCDASGLEIRDCCFRVLLVVVKARNRDGHGLLLIGPVL